MKRRFEDQGWSLSKRDSTTASNKKATSVVNHERGELIQFAQLSRDTTAALELEKSLRKLSLKINAAQQAERLQINEMLHAALGRSLALMSANLRVLALEPEAKENEISYETEDVLPAREYMQPIRAFSARGFAEVSLPVPGGEFSLRPEETA
jgi:hypothetical protein